MGLKIRLVKGDYEALDDSLKTLYIADGDGYKLEVDGVEDVTGLKNKTAELLAEQKKLKDAMKAFDGLDPEAARAAILAAQQAEDERLKASGDIDAIRKQYDERIVALEAKHTSELESVTSDNAATLHTLKRERLANVLTEKGVLADRVKYLVHEMDADTELVRGDHGFDVRKKGGIGDATEFETMIESVKAQSPFFFEATNTPGSGASGSNGNSGSSAKRLTKEQVKALPPHEKREFYLGVETQGNEVIDR